MDLVNYGCLDLLVYINIWNWIRHIYLTSSFSTSSNFPLLLKTFFLPKRKLVRHVLKRHLSSSVGLQCSNPNSYHEFYFHSTTSFCPIAILYIKILHIQLKSWANAYMALAFFCVYRPIFHFQDMIVNTKTTYIARRNQHSHPPSPYWAIQFMFMHIKTMTIPSSTPSSSHSY